jgi:hypothetical protein
MAERILTQKRLMVSTSRPGRIIGGAPAEQREPSILSTAHTNRSAWPPKNFSATETKQVWLVAIG